MLRRAIEKKEWRKSYKNWKLKDTILTEKIKHKNLLLYSPEGEVFYVDILFRFCKEKNLCYTSMLQLIRQKYSQHKGWRLYQ